MDLRCSNSFLTIKKHSRTHLVKGGKKNRWSKSLDSCSYSNLTTTPASKAHFCPELMPESFPIRFQAFLRRKKHSVFFVSCIT